MKKPTSELVSSAELDLGSMMGGAPATPKAPEMPKAPEAPKDPAAPTAPAAPAAPQPSPLQPNFVRKSTGERIIFTKDKFTIGKSKVSADYSIENNSAISRTHVEIIKKNGVNYMKDLGSTNGTFVDGKRLAPNEEVLLKNGLVVRMGDEEFVFHLRVED